MNLAVTSPLVRVRTDQGPRGGPARLTNPLIDLRDRFVPDGLSPRLLTPARSVAVYKTELRGLSDGQLAARARALEATIADASKGGDANPAAVTRARAELELVRHEMRHRQEISQGPRAHYAQKAHHASDASLKSMIVNERARLDDASTGPVRDPKVAADARARLAVLEGELRSRRGDGVLPPVRSSANPATVGMFSRRVHTATDHELLRLLRSERAALKDSKSGKFKDSGVQQQAQARIAMLLAELERRGGL